MDILYQDESIIAVNKPSGLLTIRDGYNPDLPTVKSLLELDFGRCWIVHRLDKETSGILLVARNEAAHRSLNLAFENHQIRKIYHALIIGFPQNKEFIIDLPLRIDGDRRHRTIVDYDHGKPAKSKITILNSFQDCSLAEIKPETGYTHQIRSHLALSGHPILGDRLYKKIDTTTSELIARTALHAYQITFNHPSTLSPITITAPYPDDFIDTLEKLAK
ncbi:MAG: RluA family pseudouridine synthase [Chloroflexi bacterium HGW-Chloroflexi-5]|jgi:RluA family pseudouridine synthase|nr:MAG: RluA family pseudouridine synthase [Chloroflexi bacterium HGW-Chloroflexi-5]